MSEKITRRAVEVVLEMMPKPGIAGVDYGSQAYWDVLREHDYMDNQIDREIQAVMSALGRGEFSVLDLSRYDAPTFKDSDVPNGMERVSDGFGGFMLLPVKKCPAGIVDCFCSSEQ